MRLSSLIRRRLMGLLSGALAALVCVACGDSDETVATGGTGGGGNGGSGGDGGAPVVCDGHAVQGTPLFVDATDAWGLDVLGLTGQVGSQALAAADLDGDGYPDLLVHGAAGRMQVGQEPPHIRVLMNEPRDGGGRRFVDRTAESGYPGLAEGSTTEYRAANMAVFADLDNDGDLDAFSGTYNDPYRAGESDPAYDVDRSAVLLNDGSGRFTLAAPSDVQSSQPAAVAGLALADVDLDGIIDAFQSVWYNAFFREQAQPLLLGNGDGTFRDHTDAGGLGTSELRRAGFGATICDLDNDGAPELLTQSYGRRPNLLFQSDGPGHFADVGVAAGYAYDDDTTFEDDQTFLCWCADNPDDPRCEGADSPRVACSGVPSWIWGQSDQPEHLGGNTFSTACGDVDNDGLLDLYNSEIAHWWAGDGSDKSNLLRNRTNERTIRFERADRAAEGLDWVHSGVSWDEGGLYTTMGDFDGDGRLDILVGASDYDEQWGMLFHQLPDGTFEQVAESWGFVHPCPCTPVVADFDRDGDLDIVTGSSLWRTFCNAAWGGDASTPGTPEVHFYENDAASRGSYLAVRLVGDGVTTNRSAIGARVTVDAGEVVQERELGAGHGHGAMQDGLVLFFGVGDCPEAASIEVVWPDAARSSQRFERVPVNRLIEIRQGEQDIVDVFGAAHDGP